MTAQPLYFVEATFKNIRGRAFIECDRDSNSRAHIIGLIRTGEVSPVKVLEIFEDEGTCRDVTEDILAECLKQNFIALGEKFFADEIATHLTSQDKLDWLNDHRRDERKQERV